MVKFQRLIVNRLSVVLLISVVFFSATQQVLPSLKQTIQLTYPEAEPTTYPKLNFSTYLGGSDRDYGSDIAVSADGCCYVAGATQSADFPILNAYYDVFNNRTDTFVAKFSTNGELLWSTFLGGSYWDGCKDIAVGSDGSCYVIGETESNDFPTLNAYNSTFGGFQDAFITKFSSSGSLLWSTYLGGNDYDHCRGVAVATDGSCYITGSTESSDFPLLNAFNSTLGGYYDAFVSKFSSEGSLLWSTFLGGSGGECGYAIAVTSDGNCYVTGYTYSSNFPTQYAYDSTYNGGSDVFFSKFNVSGSLLWGTYLGGSEGNDRGFSLAVTEDGNCFVIGYTNSDDFPTQNAFDNTLGSTSDAFVTKFFDPPIPPTNPLTVTGFLVFIAIMLSAVLPVIALIIYKKQK